MSTVQQRCAAIDVSAAVLRIRNNLASPNIFADNGRSRNFPGCKGHYIQLPLRDIFNIMN